MKSLYSPKLLKARIEAIELPSKEKTLPHAACEKQIKTRRFAMPIYFKKFATAAVAVALAVVIGLQGIWLLNSKKDNRLLICTDDNYNESYFVDEWISSETPGDESTVKYISNDLTEKLQEYAGQDVLFRVRVGALKHGDSLSDLLDFFNKIGAKNITKASDESDIVSGDLENDIIMEVTAEMIRKIADKKQCRLSLAPVKRVDGYDKKITDTLTDRLEKTNETDTIEVAVVLTVDVNNYYAYKQGICTNFAYNSEHVKDLSVYDFLESYEANGHVWYHYKSYDTFITSLVKSVIERNNLDSKIISNSELPVSGCETAFEIYSKKVSARKAFENSRVATIAGFNAALTKAEILALTKDSDVKAIYAAERRDEFTTKRLVCY